MKKWLLNITLLLLVFFSACSEKNDDKKFIAKVGNKKLTEEDFKQLVDFSNSSNRHKSEVIRRWIEEELLFQESQEDGITENERYKFLSELNSQKLAGALLLQEYFESHEPVISESDLRSFYDENKNNFELNDDMYIYNLAGFSDENSAIRFRKKLVSNEIIWSDTPPADTALYDYMAHKQTSMHDIYPVQILRSLTKLQPGEISIVIKTEPETYNIVQLLEKIDKGSIPGYEYIKEKVKLRYRALKEKQIYNKFYKELYTKYNVEINKDYE